MPPPSTAPRSTPAADLQPEAARRPQDPAARGTDYDAVWVSAPMINLEPRPPLHAATPTAPPAAETQAGYEFKGD